MFVDRRANEIAYIIFSRDLIGQDSERSVGLSYTP